VNATELFDGSLQTASEHKRLVFLLATPRPELAAAVRQAAGALGIGLRLVETAPDALRAGSQSRPDAYLIDAAIGGGMNVSELLFALKDDRQSANVPVLLMCHSAEPEIRGLGELASATPGVDVCLWDAPQQLPLRIRWLAQHCESTLQLQQLASSVDRLMTIDMTTGVLNHEEILRMLRSQCRISERYGRDLSVIYADLDYIGLLNEQHGFEAGDRALKAFADAVTRSARAADIVGRLGGADFLIVCPETKLDGAQILAERIRQTALQLFEDRLADSTVPVSATMACAQKTDKEDDASLLARVGKALRVAKETARNRVVLAAPPRFVGGHEGGRTGQG
jgi:diguanylate cyclase (GGDEF)-like protein